MSLYEKTLNEFLELAASKSPTPGGGSVSAVVGTHAAAMVCMVANLTLGKKKYEEVQAAAIDILSGASEAIASLKELTAQDMAAFEQVMIAWRAPGETEEERASKARALTEAAIIATQVPLEIARTCLRVLELAARLAPIGNQTAISDVGVAAYLADAALRSALLSVDINLPSLGQDAYRDEALAEKNALLKASEELKAACLAEVAKRL